MKNFDVVTIGGATLDIMFSTDKALILNNRKGLGSNKLLAFELGSKIVSHNVIYTHGGGAANTAVSFAKLGLRVGVISAIGKGTHGQGILSKFKKEKLDSSFVQTTDGYTGLSFVVTGGQKKDHVIFKHNSANDLLVVKESVLNNINTKWYYITSLSGKAWKENLITVFKMAQKKSIKVAWNPGGVQLKKGYPVLKKYLNQTEALILNKEEAMSLVDSAGVKTNKIPDLIKIMHVWGIKYIAITEGYKGATVCSGESACFQKALPFVGINTTGAGDAFGSSLIGGLMVYNNNLKKALRLAIIRSNYVVRVAGAQEGLLTLAEASKVKI